MSTEVVVAKPHRVEYQSSVPSGTKSSTPGVGPLVSQYRIFNLFVCLFFYYQFSLWESSSTLV